MESGGAGGWSGNVICWTLVKPHGAKKLLDGANDRGFLHESADSANPRHGAGRWPVARELPPKRHSSHHLENLSDSYQRWASLLLPSFFVVLFFSSSPESLLGGRVRGSVLKWRSIWSCPQRTLDLYPYIAWMNQQCISSSSSSSSSSEYIHINHTYTSAAANLSSLLLSSIKTIQSTHPFLHLLLPNSNMSMIGRLWGCFNPPTPPKSSDAIKFGVLGAAGIA